MKKLGLIALAMLAATVSFAVISVFAQTSLSQWPFFVEVGNTGAPGLYDFVVPLGVMDKARDDLADLRLYDARGREIPYAVRIRREFDERREIGGSVFNESIVGLSASEASVDLGENHGEHNEVEIQTAGSNFRRQVEIEGSDSGKEWKTLNNGGLLLSFTSQNSAVESNRITYPTSRYRFLRVRVQRDELSDGRAPQITGIKALRGVRAKGELTTWGVPVPSHQFLRNQGAYASVWTIDLGARVPCDRLALEIADASFSRPFQVESIDDPQNVRLIATGELTRHLSENPKPLAITFDEEQHVRKLRLLFTDYSNQTLSITSIQASAPTRQLVFELKEPPAQPLRLFFGNPKITHPHYDFEKELPSRISKLESSGTQPTLDAGVQPASNGGAQPALSIGPIHSTTGAVVPNPEFKPEPLPFTERLPWLIYLVLAASSIALALILLSLARATLEASPPQTE